MRHQNALVVSGLKLMMERLHVTGSSWTGGCQVMTMTRRGQREHEDRVNSVEDETRTVIKIRPIIYN